MDKNVKGLAELRRKCETRLRSLELPAPFDLESFCRSLSARRRRPIVLQPLEVPAGLGGLWAATEKADYVLYQAGTRPLHRLQIILHELSHLICDHQPMTVTEEEFLRVLLPDLSPQAFGHMLKRAAYSTEEEREAELLATLLLTRIVHDAAGPAAPDDSPAQGIRRRLENSLEDDGERRQ